MKKEEADDICNQVRGCAYNLHCFLRHGHLEKVYENGMINRLGKREIPVFPQYPVPVFDEDGAVLGNLIADLLVANELIVELKATEAVTDAHVAQLLGYLRASRKRFGLLINFGSPRLYIKRFVLDPL